MIFSVSLARASFGNLETTLAHVLLEDMILESDETNVVGTDVDTVLDITTNGLKRIDVGRQNVANDMVTDKHDFKFLVSVCKECATDQPSVEY